VSNMVPSKEQAHQFAIMLRAGLPASEAILYFTDSEDPRELQELLGSWTRSRAVKVAMAELAGKAWTDLTLEEQIKNALDQHYRGLAYFLHSHHYAEVGDKDKAKLDTARTALEQKQAGTAGKGDALTRFFDDINTGRVKLSVPKLN
jgi:hypothetical protein